MDAEQLNGALAEITEQLRLLGERNVLITDRNDALHHQNQQQGVDLADYRRRMVQLERAFDDGGVPMNGGGGLQGRDPRGANGDAPGPPRNPRMPGLAYEGREQDDWVSFRQAFVNAALFNAYSPQQAKWALKGCMKGAAFLSIQGLDHVDDNITVDNLMDSYEAKFVPPAASDLASTRFETAAQGPKEGILQWHGRLQMLFVRAYGGGGDALGVRILVRSFARGLRHKRVREHVLRTQPETYEGALNAAQTEQAVLDAGNYIPGASPEFATNIAGQQPRGGAHHHGGEPMEIGAIGNNGKIQCHNCHLFGHIARECEKPKKANGGATATVAGRARAPRPAGATGGFARRKGEPEKKTHRRFINAINDVVKEYEGQEDDDDDQDGDLEDGGDDAGDSEESQDFSECAS